MDKDTLVKSIASAVQVQDGYVLSKEIEIFCRRLGHPELFEDVCRHFVANGIDVVDEDYEDIYRRKRGMDREDETDEDSDAITKDLEKRYNDKIEAGYRGLLESYGLARGVFMAISKHERKTR